MTDAEADEIERQSKDELEKAVDYARKSPDPKPEDALTDVFA